MLRGVQLCSVEEAAHELALRFVHFDEHSDLGFPYLSSPVPRLGAAVGDNAKFAYDQLAIGNFVYPLLLQGRIDPFIWIRPDDMPLEASDRVVQLFSRHCGRRDICITSDIEVAGALNWSRRSVQISETSLARGLSVPTDCPIFVDINLDYFACDAIHGGGWKIEITEAAFTDFRKNKYNSVRLLYGGARASVFESGGRFWFTVDEPFRAALASRLSSQSEVSRKLDRVVDWIVGHRSRVEAICICKSHRSGFTPAGSCGAILDALVARLHEALPISLGDIDGILSDRSASIIDTHSSRGETSVMFAGSSRSGSTSARKNPIVAFKEFLAGDVDAQLRLQGDTMLEFLSEALRIAADYGHPVTIHELAAAIQDATLAADRYFDDVYFKALVGRQ